MNINLSNLVPVSEIQKNYRRIFDRVKRTKQPIILMRENEPDIALIDTKTLADLQKAYEENESVKETKAILADKSLMKKIKQARKDLKKGEFLTIEELENKLGLT